MDDKAFLNWVYERLQNIYGENPNRDYMHRFKKIIEAMPDQPAYPTWVCTSCGVKHGKGPRALLSSYHLGVCQICGTLTDVTEPRDFGHLKPGWEASVK